MYRALDIANYFILQSLNTGIFLNGQKLNKMVFFAHGYYLALTDNPLINEAVINEKYGPIIRSIYKYFLSYGNKQILAMESGLIKFPESDIKILNRIWEVYNPFSAIEIASLANCTDSFYGKNKHLYKENFPNNAIKEYFKNKISTRNQKKL